MLIQENHTFDQIFGLFPGVNGQYVENLGTYLAQETDCQPDPMTGGCQRPFLISANPSSPNYVADAPDITGGNNGRYDQEASIDRGRMDDFLVDVEAGQPVLGPTPSPQQIEAHNEAIGIEDVYDCDTVPYLWYYARNFALFDHYFQANTGDSTPSNIQLFSGQIGQTEAAAGEGIPSQPLPSGGYSDGVPISNDDNPPASQLKFPVTSYGGDAGTFQSYATMPVLLNPDMDRAAAKSKVVGLIGRDMVKEGRSNRSSLPWAWYEEGLYTANAGFSAHHTAPLYFDYMNNAGSAFANKRTLRDNAQSNGLISDIQSGKLPGSGVFWVKGGNENTYGFVPADSIFTNNSAGKEILRWRRRSSGKRQFRSSGSRGVSRRSRQRHRAKQILERLDHRRNLGRQRRLLRSLGSSVFRTDVPAGSRRSGTGLRVRRRRSPARDGDLAVL